MSELILIALGTLASEDLACITAGVLVAQGKIGFLPAAAAALAGILGGDILLFLLGRWIGRPALNWRLLPKSVTAESVARASAWIGERGLTVVLIARFLPGLRLPVYFAAGVLRTDLRRFLIYFCVAALVWTPLLVGASAIFGETALRRVLSRAGGVQTAALAGLLFAALLALQTGVRALARFESRRRIAGWFGRITRWEFWPVWAAYLPLVPYWVYLALRFRSLTAFTAANPAIPGGGLDGESKAAILDKLGAVAPWELLPAEGRRAAAERFARREGYPVVLKPDVGERGAGVAIVRGPDALLEYLHANPGGVLIQRYVGGVEFGVFYVRRPGEDRGRVTSITEKQFPSVTGDGQSSLRTLVLRDGRAVCMERAYERALGPAAFERVPAAGEHVPLIEIGTHSRGAIFLDGSAYWTPALENAIHRAATVNSGFQIGRFDVRAPSVDDFRAGRFAVLEFNGVTGEPTHIYDPRVGILAAYRAMAAQWRWACEIGRANIQTGAQPLSLADLIRLATARLPLRRTRSTAPRLALMPEN